MTGSSNPPAPGFDLPKAAEVAQAHAKQAGALVPLLLDETFVEDSGVRFALQWLSSLALKDLAKIPRAGDKPSDFNPFLPYEKDLHVADISTTHVSILNKFPAAKRHLLFVTKTFVDQETPWTQGDFNAAATALHEMEGLLFYNSGTTAGASQRHRHLQIIEDHKAPIESLFPKDGAPLALQRLAAMPFVHLFCRLGENFFADIEQAERHLAEIIPAAYREAGLIETDNCLRPYNILMTRDWFLLVPRAKETCEGISLSALGYAGLIGLRDQSQAEIVKQYGPMRMLVEAAG
jgi:ATP adenylyltransferase